MTRTARKPFRLSQARARSRFRGENFSRPSNRRPLRTSQYITNAPSTDPAAESTAYRGARYG
ncbi:MAG: hypothetical protein O7F56_02920 [Acidobacteria bacterium]|nr:hypothetical protein [Acidobacteriota bacterium]